MFKHLTGDKRLGLLAAVFALVLIFVWVPLDTDTGLIEKVRRQVTLGDSLGPTIAGVVILLGGCLTFLGSEATAPSLSANNLRWVGVLLGIVAVSMILMRFSGPAITALMSEQPYRNLRATPPWNYIGFLAGGAALVALLISLVGRKFTWKSVLIGLIASLAIALLYDVPFDDLQLPPNGDV